MVCQRGHKVIYRMRQGPEMQAYSKSSNLPFPLVGNGIGATTATLICARMMSAASYYLGGSGLYQLGQKPADSG